MAASYKFYSGAPDHYGRSCWGAYGTFMCQYKTRGNIWGFLRVWENRETGDGWKWHFCNNATENTGKARIIWFQTSIPIIVHVWEHRTYNIVKDSLRWTDGALNNIIRCFWTLRPKCSWDLKTCLSCRPKGYYIVNDTNQPQCKVLTFFLLKRLTVYNKLPSLKQIYHMWCFWDSE